MRIKSIVSESKQIQRAIALIKLGARLQVLESETDLSYERLLRLYKEVQGESPARGMLPFSTDWFMTWQPNIHSSLFLNMYEYLDKTSELEEIDGIIKAYELYLEQIRAQGLEPLLSVTRAWRLVKFVDAGMVTLTSCCKCNGKFVTHTFELTKNYVCGLCEPPARAGKGKAQVQSWCTRGSALAEYPAANKKPASRGLFHLQRLVARLRPRVQRHFELTHQLRGDVRMDRQFVGLAKRHERHSH